MEEIINNYRDFVILFTGWLLGFGAQLIFHILNKGKDSKNMKIQSFLRLKSAIKGYQHYLRDCYKCNALTLSYFRKTEIAKREEQPEIYKDMKSFYHRNYERQLSYNMKEGEIENILTTAIYESLAIFKNNSMLINWAVNLSGKYEFNKDLSPDFTNCETYEQVENKLLQFQQEVMFKELSRLDSLSSDIINHLGKKYIIRIIDVSNVRWYLRPFERFRSKYL